MVGDLTGFICSLFVFSLCLSEDAEGEKMQRRVEPLEPWLLPHFFVSSYWPEISELFQMKPEVLRNQM